MKAFILYCAHLIVPLTSSKVLAFDNKNKKRFILYCAHLIVPLHQEQSTMAKANITHRDIVGIIQRKE